MSHQSGLRHTVRHDDSHCAWNISTIRKGEQSIGYLLYQAIGDVEAPNGDENQSDSTHKVLRNKKPSPVCILSIGGWSGSGFFSSAVATDANRTAFAKPYVTLLSLPWPSH